MIDFYFWTTPNGYKVLMFLEEAGISYRIVPVNISKGEQFDAEFLKISPNNKMPAIIDNSPVEPGAPISIFESGAILQYLAEKPGTFCQKTCLDVAKYCSGCFGKWVGSVQCSDRTCTSASMRRRKYRTRSTAM